jgi:hypothetical protein
MPMRCSGNASLVYMDGSAYSFARLRQHQVEDRVPNKDNRSAASHTLIRSPEKVVVALMAGSCHRPHAAG